MTPQRDGSIGYFGPSAQEDLSPIAEVSTTNTSTELLHQEVAQFEQKGVMEKSDSGEGDEYDSEEDDENEDDEESEDGSEDSEKSGNSTVHSESEEEFEPGSDDDEYESESTELSTKNIRVTRASVNTDPQKNDQPKKSVHLRIEDINFTDSSQNKDVNNSKTTADVSATANVTTTDPNTDIDMLASGGNFVAHNPERSATGIDFPQYNSEKDMGAGINILSNKIETAEKKESSDIDIPPDMNEMEYLDDDHMDEDPLEGQNESDDSDKSTPKNVGKGDDNKGSEKINTNDSVSGTNPVDGEKGTVKKSEPVVIIKYGCKKCTKICYTESGYHTHLFRAHRIRNVKYYPAQIIEGTTVNSADVHADQFGAKEEPKYLCDECGQLFFHESSIATHKIHAHRASRDDNTNGNDGVQNKSEVMEDNKKDEDEEKLEEGRQILNTMICKPGSKKKPKMSQRKPRSPHKISNGMKNTKLQRSARIANSSQETIDNEPTVNSDETKSASEIEKTLPDIIPPRRITR